MSYKGFLITFEGIDGSGKSTQARLLEKHLTESGYSVRLLREPGGTSIGERIRSILLDTAHTDMVPRAEVFLYLAARAQITASVIIPALEQGDIVIMDRYLDSTTVYQGYARGLGVDEMKKLNAFATYNVIPDLTFVVDCDPTTAYSRLSGSPDRLESEGLSFMEKVREGFLSLCESEGERMVLIDGGLDVDVIADSIRSIAVAGLSSHAF